MKTGYSFRVDEDPFSQTLLFSSSRDYLDNKYQPPLFLSQASYCKGDQIAKMFLPNFLPGTPASWRALTLMDRNNLVFNDLAQLT